MPDMLIRQGVTDANLAERRMSERRFVALCERLNAGTDLRALFKSMLKHYSEQSRFYHSRSHLEHCLAQFDEARSAIPDPDAVEIALWFHDVIYDPFACDNELKSAELFMQKLGRQIDPDRAELIHRLIMATVHDRLPGCINAAFVVDIDLSSFALPWKEFEEDSAAIRREYEHLPDEEFYAKQYRFLHGLASRETLYSTPYFKERKESLARENLTRRLDALKARGFGP